MGGWVVVEARFVGGGVKVTVEGDEEGYTVYTLDLA